MVSILISTSLATVYPVYPNPNILLFPIPFWHNVTSFMFNVIFPPKLLLPAAPVIYPYSTLLFSIVKVTFPLILPFMFILSLLYFLLPPDNAVGTFDILYTPPFIFVSTLPPITPP